MAIVSTLNHSMAKLIDWGDVKSLRSVAVRLYIYSPASLQVPSTTDSAYKLPKMQKMAPNENRNWRNWV